jgi:RNA polymerase primary sigma factor
MAEIINNINKTEQELTNNLGRSPSVVELSKALGGAAKGYTPQKISNLKKILSNPVSLEKSIKTDVDSQFSNFVKDTSSISPEKNVETELRNQKVREAIGRNLTIEEEEVINMRHAMGEYPVVLSLDEVARKLKTTKEKVRQIEAKAIRKLRHPSKSGDLASFAKNLDFDD